MNGKWIKDLIMVVLTVISLTLAAVGGAFLFTLLISPLYLAHPTDLNGLTRGQELAEYGRLLAYLLLPGVKLHFAHLPLAAAGYSHFAAVKHLIWAGITITIVAALSLRPLLTWVKRHYRLGWVLRGVTASSYVLAGLAVLIVLRFEDAFLLFHHLAFSDLTWQFTTKKEPVIRLLSLAFFWRSCLSWLVTSAGLIWLSQRYLNRLLANFLLAAHPAPNPADDCRDQGHHDDGQDNH